ncbi:MAG: NADP-dependent oxidoreductase [Acidobacteria bacterium]|nr:NADP-dependent oxidoreductase [Acidobacteriota bacterium]
MPLTPDRVNRQVLLNARPVGFPVDTDFKMVEALVPEPALGQLLIRTIYLSLDPYMRGRMDATASYAKPVQLGSVMEGGTVGEVVASKHDQFEEGELVLSANGWQEYAISDGQGIRKLDPSIAPVSTALGVLGMPGMTAYVGLLEVGELKVGDTVVVSAASGAVGAVVGQIAKIKGHRVVGVAGVQKKCTYVTDELGFDACVSHQSDTLAVDLAAVCPDGIDLYFENVGGKVFDAVLPLLNQFARVPICGRIANYNMTSPPEGPNGVPHLMGLILIRRLRLRGFIVWDHADSAAEFIREVGGWVRSGQLKYREDIVDGLGNAVTAFQGMLRGRNFGKLLVRVSDDKTR